MPKYLIGIDGGGTKTEYLLGMTNGEVLNKVTHAQTNLSATGGLGMAAFNLREGLRQLLINHSHGEIAVLVLAVAGLDTKKEREQARVVLEKTFNTWKIKRMVLLNDTIAALINGTSQPEAVVLVGGTGSHCVGRNAKGKFWKVGGLGHLLSDDGSGYDAGRLALKTAVMSSDGRIAKTVLQERVLNFFGAACVADLKEKVYNPDLSKSEIASLAKLTVEAMRDGDWAAQQIVNYCLGILLGYVVTAVECLALRNKFELVISGSFIANLVPEFQPLLQEKIPQANLITPAQPPVFGSLKIAQKVAAGAKGDDFWFFES